MKCLATLFCLFVSLPVNWSFIRPSSDARHLFANHFYRTLVYHQESREHDIVISPAAVQKFMILIYNVTESQLGDQMLWDLSLKHIDLQRLLQDVKKKSNWDFGFTEDVKAQQLKELSVPMRREDVLNYFKNDFTEVVGNVFWQNTVLASHDLKLSANFTQFSKLYFNTDAVNKNVDSVAEIVKTFGDILNDSADLELLSVVNMTATLKNKYKFTIQDDKLMTVGSFKYGVINSGFDVDFHAKVLELPLDVDTTPMTIIFVMASNDDLATFVTQMIGRNVEDFNEFSKDLKDNVVKIKLPQFKLKTVINLANYFKEIGEFGLKDLFEKNIKLNGVFESAPKNDVKLNSFWLQTTVQLTANEERELNEKNLNSTQTFDATEQSFFFVIKSKEAIYFMGHYIHKA